MLCSVTFMQFACGYPVSVTTKKRIAIFCSYQGRFPQIGRVVAKGEQSSHLITELLLLVSTQTPLNWELHCKPYLCNGFVQIRLLALSLKMAANCQFPHNGCSLLFNSKPNCSKL